MVPGGKGYSVSFLIIVATSTDAVEAPSTEIILTASKVPLGMANRPRVVADILELAWRQIACCHLVPLLFDAGISVSGGGRLHIRLPSNI